MVSNMSGIHLTEAQYPMIEARLKTRLLKLKINSLESYLKYLEGNSISEEPHLLSLITTHYTYFFREFDHFEFMINKSLPRLIESVRRDGRNKINIMCAGCSSGEEAYSLAMFYFYHLKFSAPDLDFQIDAGDIDSETVKKAQNGVYRVESMKQIPAMYIGEHWIKGSGSALGFAKVKDSLKQKINFTALNAINPGPRFSNKKYDIIFCRNVYIYFHENQIKESARQMLNLLQPEGYFFTGVSESLASLGLSINAVGSSIYQHQGVKSKAEVVRTIENKILKVLCVDDSPTILSLLKSILNRENGFELAATASNGKEAVALIQSGATFDLMTLDIHMPEMDGISFLEKTKNIKRPPVLMLSSVDRDDPGLGKKVIALGAYDYVEKPSLQNISQAASEIRAKLKMMSAVVPNPTAQSERVSAAPATSIKKNKVMIIDDSATVRKLLKNIISQDYLFEVVSEIENPLLALKEIKIHQPDLITLDVHMPEINGVELLKKIRQVSNSAVVMVSSISKEEGPFIMEALSCGAIDYIQKPQFDHLESFGVEIRKKLKLICQSKAKTIKPLAQPINFSGEIHFNQKSLILLGASTGGVEALPYILKSFPLHMPPIMIVQHIPAGFSQAFAQRLQSQFKGKVKEAEHGDKLLPNHVYLAPGGSQVSLKKVGDEFVIRIDHASSSNLNNPSVDVLFKSVAALNKSHVVAALLTGMGDDGAAGMRELKDRGAKTIAQDESTCVVYGMPREAVLKGAASVVKPLNEIAATIIQFVKADPVKKSA